MLYKGSCHCGKVAFEATGELASVTECNCSICSKRGSLHWFVPAGDFKLLSGDDSLGTYTFNKHQIKHRFCPTCGCATYGEGTGPSGDYVYAVNARCLEDVDLSALEVGHFDGRHRL